MFVPATASPSAMSSASPESLETSVTEPSAARAIFHFWASLPKGVHCHTFVPGVRPPLATSSTLPVATEVIV